MKSLAERIRPHLRAILNCEPASASDLIARLRPAIETKTYRRTDESYRCALAKLTADGTAPITRRPPDKRGVRPVGYILQEGEPIMSASEADAIRHMAEQVFELMDAGTFPPDAVRKLDELRRQFAEAAIKPEPGTEPNV